MSRVRIPSPAPLKTLSLQAKVGFAQEARTGAAGASAAARGFSAGPHLDGEAGEALGGNNRRGCLLCSCFTREQPRPGELGFPLGSRSLVRAGAIREAWQPGQSDSRPLPAALPLSGGVP